MSLSLETLERQYIQQSISEEQRELLNEIARGEINVSSELIYKCLLWSENNSEFKRWFEIALRSRYMSELVKLVKLYDISISTLEDVLLRGEKDRDRLDAISRLIELRKELQSLVSGVHGSEALKVRGEVGIDIKRYMELKLSEYSEEEK